MPRPLANMIFAVDPERTDGGEPAYVSNSAKDLNLKESWFSDTIANNLDLVILPCEGANLTDEQWHSWQREFLVKTPSGNAVGKADLLMISDTGRIGILETKLAYNPENRRNVVAQILDYAVHLSEMKPQDMPEIPKNDDNEPVAGYDDMAQHLADGDFLLIIVGDNLDERAVRLSEALLGDHLVNPWDLALVDLALYVNEKESDTQEYLIVPTLRKAVISEPRHIVRVVIEGKEPKARVSIERPPAEATGGGRRPSERQFWDANRFFLELEKSENPTEWKDLGKRLYGLTDKFSDVTASFGTGKHGSLTVKKLNNGLIEYYIKGRLRFRPRRFKMGLGSTVGQLYHDELRRLFPEHIDKSHYPSVMAKDCYPLMESLLELIETTLEKAEKRESQS